MFEKQRHIVYTFLLDVGRGGTGGGPDGGDGGWPVVDQAVVGDLHPAAVVVHRLVRMLFQVGKVGTDGLSRVFRFKNLQELGFDVVPDGQIDGVVAKRLPPDEGPFSEA